MTNTGREIVIPSQYLGSTKEYKSGRGTYIDKEDNKIYSQLLGILQISENKNNDQKEKPYLNVQPIKGKYDAIVGDMVIGIVEEPLSSSWLVNINAPYPALLHVNEVPWKVDFNETEKYLNSGDTIMAKVFSVDFEKKLQVTMKEYSRDRNKSKSFHKIRGGTIIEIEPSKIPRIIGKKGSMINLLKQYTHCRIFVGKNGRIWIDGEDDNITKAIQTISLIEREAISYGLTNKVESFLKNYSDSKEV
jgi:exosome complex component RRP4